MLTLGGCWRINSVDGGYSTAFVDTHNIEQEPLPSRNNEHGADRDARRERGHGRRAAVVVAIRECREFDARPPCPHFSSATGSPA